MLCRCQRSIRTDIEDAGQLLDLATIDQLIDLSESSFDGIVALLTAQTTVRFSGGRLVLVVIDDGQQWSAARPCAERQMRIPLPEPGGQIGRVMQTDNDDG